MIRCAWLRDTPVGDVLIEGTDAGLTRIALMAGEGATGPDPTAVEDPLHPVIGAGLMQLGEYFRGDRQGFDLPLAPTGTTFQRAVWGVLSTIPFGTTWSYGDVAVAVGRPAAVRAVGAANGRNPLPVVVPCHRVIGANGSLTGFRGGLPLKVKLLALEGIGDDAGGRQTSLWS